MRLLSYRTEPGGAWHAGIVDETDAVDLALPGDRLEVDGHIGPSIRRLLAAGPDALADRVGRALERAADTPGVATPLREVRHGAPVVDPEKIICLGLNYREHADEVHLKAPVSPVLFAKFRNSLTGAGAPIPCRPGQQLDYEGELAVVIGRTCSDVTAEDAPRYIAGVMPFNDVSDRELQFRAGQWLPGKFLDGFAPCGPYLVTIDEIEDLQDLQILTRLNGETVQHGSTAEMIFTVAETVAYLSTLVTLVPGDVVSTGTPSGVGFTRTPPLFMRDGDAIEVEITGVGVLGNHVTFRCDPLDAP